MLPCRTAGQLICVLIALLQPREASGIIRQTVKRLAAPVRSALPKQGSPYFCSGNGAWHLPGVSSTVQKESAFARERSILEIGMKKLLAIAVLGVFANGMAVAAEQGATGTSGAGAEEGTNVGLTIGVAAATAAVIGVVVNAAAGDESNGSTTIPPPNGSGPNGT
jgi:hypothetical protein